MSQIIVYVSHDGITLSKPYIVVHQYGMVLMCALQQKVKFPSTGLMNRMYMADEILSVWHKFAYFIAIGWYSTEHNFL